MDQMREVIRIWHAGDPASDDKVIELEFTARGGGMIRIRVDRATGGMID